MTSCDVFANLADSVQQCLSLMVEKRLRYLPVQEEGNPIALLSFFDLLSEMVAYLERVFKENELDQQIVFLRGTYSC
jgi:signal-transduction protein with cAMP-binding, CBS, and nucleotidyltransferase domain